MKKLKILLVEDTAEYADLVLRWMSCEPNPLDFALSWTDTLSSALARIRLGEIDLVLLDLGLPDSEGLSTFLSVRSAAPGLPAIILSGGDEENLALQTIQLGAQDYLVKSTCTPEILIRAICHSVVRHKSAHGTFLAENAEGRARVIGVVGGPGGAGATTVASVLAAEIGSQTAESTLVMDLDSNPGLVAFTMGVTAAYSIYDALKLGDQLDGSCWDAILVPYATHVRILASGRSLGEADSEIGGLRKLIDFARTQHKWIVVDLGRLNQRSTRLLEWMDEIVLVGDQSIPGLYQCKEAISVFSKLNIEQGRIKLIFNQNKAADSLPQNVIEKLFGVAIAASLPPSHAELYESVVRKELPRPESNFRMVLAKVARQLAGLPVMEQKSSMLSFRSITGRFRSKASNSNPTVS